MGTDGKCIRVLVAEDNHDLATAIGALISAEPDMRVDGTVADVSLLLDAVAHSGLHVVVLDLDLGGVSSVPALVQLRRSRPHMAVVVYSGHDARDLRAAVAGFDRSEFVTKSGDPAELIDAIRRAAGNVPDADD